MVSYKTVKQILAHFASSPLFVSFTQRCVLVSQDEYTSQLVNQFMQESVIRNRNSSTGKKKTTPSSFCRHFYFLNQYRAASQGL